MTDPSAEISGLILSATDARERGERAAAVALLERAAALTPHGHFCHQLLGSWLRKDGRLAQARAVLEPEVAHAPTIPALIELARVSVDDGDGGRALALIREAAAIEAGDAAAGAAVRALQQAIAHNAGRLDHLLGSFSAEHRHPKPFVHFAGRPHGAYADTGSADGPRLDGWGFPNPTAPSAAKPAGEFRIFVLGDSTLFNGADLADTVPAKLQAELERAGCVGAKVYNFSIVSSSAMQMVALLFLELVDYAPDLVILCNGAIDLMNPREYDPRPGYPFNFFLVEQLWSHFFDPVRVRQALTRAELLERAAAHQLQLREDAGWATEPWETRIVESYLRSVERLGRLADAYAIDTVLLLEPMTVTRDQPTADEIAYLKPETAAYYARQYARLRGGLFADGAPAARRGAHLTIRDASAAFAGEPATVFSDFLHFNPTGSRLMAVYLAGLVRDRLAVRRAD